MSKLIAFHNDHQLKADVLAEVERHRLNDQIVKGAYGKGSNGGWKGCGVGCSLHSLNLIRGTAFKTSDHSAYEKGFGSPRILARLEDGIFENLPAERVPLWPGQFLAAVPVGVDLSLIWPRFAVWMLIDPQGGGLQFAKRAQSQLAIKNVAENFQRWAETGANPLKSSDWRKLRVAAAAAADAYAAADAAYAAAYAAAAYAAYAAADDAAAAAAYAADDAAAAAAAYAAYAADDAAAAAAAADAADAYAADAAADAYAAYAADDAAAAADAAAYAADDAAAAAAAAADAADDAAARTKWRMAQADKLIELLAAAK